MSSLRKPVRRQSCEYCGELFFRNAIAKHLSQEHKKTLADMRAVRIKRLRNPFYEFETQEYIKKSLKEVFDQLKKQPLPF